MAGRRREDNHDSFWGSLGKGLLIGAGVVAAGAAVAAGAWAAANAAETQLEGCADSSRKKSKKSPDFDNGNGPGRADSNGVDRAGPSRQIARADPPRSLKEKLEDYQATYARVSPARIEVMKGNVNIALQIVNDHFANHRDVELESIEGVGSAFEGLKVIAADEIDFDLSFRLRNSPELCLKQLQGCEHPGFWLVCSKTAETPLPAATNNLFVSDFAYGLILSPEKISSFFQSQLQRAFNGRDEFQLVERGPAWRVVYTPRTSLQSVYINFVPTIHVAGRRLVTKAHPGYQKAHDAQLRHLWRESFAVEEMASIREFPADSCQRACLQIIKTIRHNFPAEFRRFDSYVYKTILLNMNVDSCEEEWSWDCLAERYLDFLMILCKSLTNGELKHHFVPELNLFLGFTNVQMGDFANFLRKRIHNNAVDKLLDRKDVSNTGHQKWMDEGSEEEHSCCDGEQSYTGSDKH